MDKQLRDHIFYMAPMLGITDSSFRSAFMQAFGGFDYSISPFVRTLQGQRYKKSGVVDLQPHMNGALKVYPQILTNQIDDFIHLANVLFDLGYPVINLNMGCPVPTASGKGRGAGLLPEIDYVDHMFDKVLSAIPNKLSVKTRIGMEAEDDLLKMTKVFNRYPLHEIIIHPRTASQKYKGCVNHEAFALASSELIHETVYSGDIFSPEEFASIRLKHPGIKKWMLGRGILQDPFLMSKIKGTTQPKQNSVRDFFIDLSRRYKKRDLSDHIVLTRLKILLVYLGIGRDFPKPVVKALRKSKSIDDLIAGIPPCDPEVT